LDAACQKVNISTDVPLATLQQQLEAIRLEFQEFTSTVSHDLRAPLRHITAYVQVMTEDWPDMPQDMADHLATIRQSAQLLGQQLDGLTQLSRWGQQEIQLQAVNVSVMAQEVANTIMQNSSAHHVQWHLAKDVPLVWADADMLRTALSNLLGNAGNLAGIFDLSEKRQIFESCKNAKKNVMCPKISECEAGVKHRCLISNVH
jgi:light-regulated signal transduction histidine kinase (bacteriophytochrome)